MLSVWRGVSISAVHDVWTILQDLCAHDGTQPTSLTLTTRRGAPRGAPRIASHAPPQPPPYTPTSHIHTHTHTYPLYCLALSCASPERQHAYASVDTTHMHTLTAFAPTCKQHVFTQNNRSTSLESLLYCLLVVEVGLEELSTHHQGGRTSCFANAW